MNTEQQKGYDFTLGCMRCLGKYLIIGWLLVTGYNLARNSFAWGLDDSDRDGRNRSGLAVHTDAKTGVQYLSDGKGGLVRRDSR